MRRLWQNQYTNCCPNKSNSIKQQTYLCWHKLFPKAHLSLFAKYLWHMWGESHWSLRCECKLSDLDVMRFLRMAAPSWLCLILETWREWQQLRKELGKTFKIRQVHQTKTFESLTNWKIFWQHRSLRDAYLNFIVENESVCFASM